jgi:hypothetical protein
MTAPAAGAVGTAVRSFRAGAGFDITVPMLQPGAATRWTSVCTCSTTARSGADLALSLGWNPFRGKPAEVEGEGVRAAAIFEPPVGPPSSPGWSRRSRPGPGPQERPHMRRSATAPTWSASPPIRPRSSGSLEPSNARYRDHLAAAAHRASAPYAPSCASRYAGLVSGNQTGLVVRATFSLR